MTTKPRKGIYFAHHDTKMYHKVCLVWGYPVGIETPRGGNTSYGNNLLSQNRTSNY